MPRPALTSSHASAVVLALLAAASACDRRGAGPGLSDHYELERTIHVAPIEPFARAPGSMLVLADGRLLLPETEGVWIHVVRATGEGITRIGGPSPAALDLPGAAAGRFRSLSALALLPDGRVLAGDRTAGVVSVFDPDLEPRGTFALPETRSVWDLEVLPDGGAAAAVAPRHPTAGGQVALFRLRDDSTPDSLRLRLPPDPVFRANRWGPVASARLEALPGGRLLAWWTTLPWARSVDAAGDSLPPLGRFSGRYVPPSSGPREGAPLERLRAWYDAFTPLVAVEAAGSLVAFQFLDAAAGDDVAAEEAARSSFLNIYDDAGRPVAADLPLSAGARLLPTNDPDRLYVVTAVRPRQMDIEVWAPGASR